MPLRQLLVALALLLAVPLAHAETQATAKTRLIKILRDQAHMDGPSAVYAESQFNHVKWYATNAELQAASPDEGNIGYAQDTNTTYVMVGTAWRPLGATIEFNVDFDEGASKGLVLQALTGATYSTTADAYDMLGYAGTNRFTSLFTTNTTATGTITPAATAVGVDLNGGSPGDNDEWTWTMGSLNTTGGYIIPGTTPAWKACATIKIEDVSGSDGCYLEVTTAGTHVDLSSNDPNYGSYAAIGNVSGTIYVSDNTTGPTSTTDTWADTATKTLCILGSAAGVITYTNGGAAPTATDPHTLGDGVPHVVRVQCINASDIANKVEVSNVKLVLQ